MVHEARPDQDGENIKGQDEMGRNGLIPLAGIDRRKLYVIIQ
jgi:hypothetical protein